MIPYIIPTAHPFPETKARENLALASIDSDGVEISSQATEKGDLELRELIRKHNPRIIFPVPENEEFSITDTMQGGGGTSGDHSYFSIRKKISLKSISYVEFTERFSSNLLRGLAEIGFDYNGYSSTLKRGNLYSLTIPIGTERSPSVTSGPSPYATVTTPGTLTVTGVINVAITNPGERDFEVIVFGYEYAK